MHMYVHMWTIVNASFYVIVCAYLPESYVCTYMDMYVLAWTIWCTYVDGMYVFMGIICTYVYGLYVCTYMDYMHAPWGSYYIHGSYICLMQKEK